MNIILGGTHGLGAEIAAQLQQAGEQTYVTGRSYDSAKHGLGAKFDHTKPEDAQAVQTQLDGLLADEKSVNLFWCVGMAYKGDFAEQTTVQEMLEVDLTGPMLLVQHLWKQMLAKDALCKLVVVSSTSGIKARAEEAVYAATKFAQAGFTRSLGLESERLGSKIHVALFLPGGMQTQFWDTMGKPDVYDEFLDPKKVAQRILERTSAQTAPYYEETIERGSL